MPYYLNITEAFLFLQFVLLKPGIDWRVVVVNWCSKQLCYLSFCLHLPVQGFVFGPIVSLPLGNLPQSGVCYDISRRREWWERQLACLACKCVLLLHTLCVHFFTFVVLLFALGLLELHHLLIFEAIWKRSVFYFKKIVACSLPFKTALSKSKQLQSIKLPLKSQTNSVFIIVPDKSKCLEFEHITATYSTSPWKCWPQPQQWRFISKGL